MYINPYYRSGQIDYDSKSFINTGIMFTLREKCYPNHQTTYGILSLLVKPPPAFRFDGIVVKFNDTILEH